MRTYGPGVRVGAYGQSMGGDILLTSLVFERRLCAVALDRASPGLPEAPVPAPHGLREPDRLQSEGTPRRVDETVYPKNGHPLYKGVLVLYIVYIRAF